MRKPALLVLIVTVLLCGFGGFFMFKQYSAAQAKKKDDGSIKVERGEIALRVVETGTIDAIKSVEVRSRASGRLKQLLVDEGSTVEPNALIAVIDPQETEFRVQQDLAQLRGARSGVARANLEIEQQRVTLREQLEQAISRLNNLKDELKVQPTLTRTQIAQAKAQLDSAIRQRETLINITQPLQMTQTEQALIDAKNNWTQAKREYERQQELGAKGYVSGRVVEAAKLEYDLTISRLEVARSNFDRLENQQKLERMRADEDVRALQAAYDRSLAGSIQDAAKRREYEQAISEVEKARANLLNIQITQKGRDQSAATVDQLQSVVDDSMRQLRETQVRAPFAGVVSKRYIEVGDLVTALSTFSSGTSIVRIEDRSRMKVNLRINEIDVARITEGMAVQVEIDALPEEKITGKVIKIAPASIAVGANQAATSSDAVVKYNVEIELSGTPKAVRTGMTAKCTLEVFKRENVVRIPIAYLGSDDKGSFVMLAPDSKDPKSKAKRQSVRIGVKTGAIVEIVEGVKEGERIVRPAFNGPERSGMMQAGRRE